MALKVPRLYFLAPLTFHDRRIAEVLLHSFGSLHPLAGGCPEGREQPDPCLCRGGGAGGGRFRGALWAGSAG